MKAFSITALACILIISGYTFYQTYTLQKQQLANYQTQVSQLLDDVDARYQSNLNSQNRIEQLQKQLESLAGELEQTRQQVDPDYQRIEQKIRQEIAAQYEHSPSLPQSSTQLQSRSALIRNLTAMDPMEMSQLMSLNMQFGPFLNSLNVSDERLDIVIDALETMLADQNQARMELSNQLQAEMQAQTQPGMPFRISPEFQERMTAISSPQAQLEALSYSLNQQELQAFEDYQESIASQGMGFASPFVNISGSSSVAAPVFMNAPLPVDLENQAITIQALPVDSSN